MGYNERGGIRGEENFINLCSCHILTYQRSKNPPRGKRKKKRRRFESATGGRTERGGSEERGKGRSHPAEKK